MAEVPVEVSEGERLWSLVLFANSQGLRLNNLYQSGPGWRANLTDGDILWEFGEGPTPSTALIAAIQAAHLTPGVPGLEPSNKPAEPARSRPRKSSALQSILELDLDL